MSKGQLIGLLRKRMMGGAPKPAPAKTGLLGGLLAKA
jgi:hypothetical protein